MEKHVNMPQLRFHEFNGEWTNSRLGNLFELFNGYAFSSTDSLDKGIPWIKIADVGIQEMKRDNLSFLPEEFEEKYKKFLINKGDFVIALTRPILNGKLKIAQADDFFNNSLLNQRVGKIVSINSHYFIFSLLQKATIINEIENSIAGTDPPNLSTNELKTIFVKIPTLSEQNKIASFFTAIDQKISQLKQKKTLLEQYKKGIMQKIFSQEIRFKDGDGKEFPPWEKSKFGKIFTFRVTNSFSRDNLNYLGGNVKNIHYGDIHTKFRTLFDITKEDVPFINPDISLKGIRTDNYCMTNDIVFADASEDLADVGKSIELVNLNNEKILAGLHTILARPDRTKIASGLGGYLMKSIGVRRQIMKTAQGSKITSITSTRLCDIELILPCPAEQTKIANFLSTIDDKINHTHMQIEMAEVWKRGLLQRMFV